jgi:hypothetical protein
MLVSSTCITVTIITDRVMAHFRADPTGASFTTPPYRGSSMTLTRLLSGRRASDTAARMGDTLGRWPERVKRSTHRAAAVTGGDWHGRIAQEVALFKGAPLMHTGAMRMGTVCEHDHTLNRPAAGRR